MNTIYLYNDPLFWEDINGIKSNREAASEIFSNVVDIDFQRNFYPRGINWRGPTELLGSCKEFDFDNWILSLHPYYLNSDYRIVDLETLSYEKWDRLYIRPVSGKKIFGGHVFTYKRFLELKSYLEQSNVGNIFVVAACPKKLDKEWRFIYVNQKLIDGSQYLDNEELAVQSYYPPEAADFANKVAAKLIENNKFEFVIDVVFSRGKYYLIEINALQTSSWYAADLTKIYREISKL